MRTSIITAIAVLTWGAAGCVSSLVGAECADGYAQCGGSCVDLDSDPLHCGACNNACLEGDLCIAGVCEGAQAADGGVELADAGAGTADGGPLPRVDRRLPGPIYPWMPERTPLRCRLGELSCGGACVRPDTDTSHCGACGNHCAADELCAAAACTSVCEAPFELCNGLCTNTQTDADNCGGCASR